MVKPRAILDVCVLYPAPLRDFLMECAVTGFYEPRWSDAIHDEWIRNLLSNRPDLTRDKLTRTVAMMDRAVPQARVSAHESLIDTLTLPDPNDRHVLAAAIHSAATYVITFNLRDFPDQALAPHGITAIHPDLFMMNTVATNESMLFAMARLHRARLINPPKTVAEYLATLRQNNMTRVADLLERNADDL